MIGTILQKRSLLFVCDNLITAYIMQKKLINISYYIVHMPQNKYKSRHKPEERASPSPHCQER